MDSIPRRSQVYIKAVADLRKWLVRLLIVLSSVACSFVLCFCSLSQDEIDRKDRTLLKYGPNTDVRGVFVVYIACVTLV